MSDLTELRKQIYNFGWILSKDNLNPPNMCLRTIFNENSTDILQINIPVSSKEQIIESLKKQLEIPRNHKIEGKIKWNSLASISLNISFNAFYGTLEIYQDTCAISYNPNRKDKIKTSGLYTYSYDGVYTFIWKHAVIDGHPRFINCHINEKELNNGLISIYNYLSKLSKIKI